MVRLSRWMGLDPDREPTTETLLEGGVFELCLEEARKEQLWEHIPLMLTDL